MSAPELAIVAALEALEAGDVGLVEAILLGAREDGSSERRHPCLSCGLSFEWPGLRDAHVERVHRYPDEAAA